MMGSKSPNNWAAGQSWNAGGMDNSQMQPSSNWADQQQQNMSGGNNWRG